MNGVNPDFNNQSPLKVLGRGSAPAETITALSSVGSAVVQGLKPITGDLFNPANVAQLEKVLKDNPLSRMCNDILLSSEAMFDIGNQSIIADTGKKNIDPVGAPEGTEVHTDAIADLEETRAIDKATGTRTPPAPRFLASMEQSKAAVATEMDQIKSSNISFNA